MKARTICVAGAAWLAAAGAWAQPGRLTLKTGEVIEGKSLRMEEGRYRLILPDGTERQVGQAEVRSVQFLEEQREIERMVRDLGAEEHAKREEATKRLTALLEHDRERVLAALPEASPDPEVKVRVEAIRGQASRREGTGSGDLARNERALQRFPGQVDIPPEVIKLMMAPPGGAGGIRIMGGGGVGKMLPMEGAQDPPEEAAPAKDVPPAAPGEIEGLVKDLGSDQFEPRDKATGRLTDLARSVEKHKVLRALPADPQDPEVKARVASIRQAAEGRRRRAAAGEKQVMNLVVGHAGPEENGGFVGEIRMIPGIELEEAGADPMKWILDSILEDLEDADPAVRAAAVKNAGGVIGDGPKGALAEEAAKLLDHDEEGVRHSAAQAIGKLAGERWAGDGKGVAAAKEWAKRRGAEGKAGAEVVAVVVQGDADPAAPPAKGFPCTVHSWDLMVTPDGKIKHRCQEMVMRRDGACESSSIKEGTVEVEKPDAALEKLAALLCEPDPDTRRLGAMGIRKMAGASWTDDAELVARAEEWVGSRRAAVAFGNILALLEGEHDEMREIAAKLAMRMSGEAWPAKDRVRLAIEWIGKRKADPRFVLPKEGVQESERFQR